MRKYFITYGDKNYIKSVERIKKEAEQLNIFNEIISYSPNDLGNDILQSQAMQYERGGGYWSWKPYVTWLTLQRMQEGDVLFYCDAGCTLTKSKEWNNYFSKIVDHDTIVFLLQNRVENWSRKSAIEYFDYLGKYYYKFFQVAATTFIIKKTPEIISLVSEWKDLMIHRPDLVLDVPVEYKQFESKRFIENRHDQSIFTGLVYKYEEKAKILIQWNNFEGSSFFKRAISATRISDERQRDSKVSDAHHA